MQKTNLIGISGKMGHGKDLVAKIIQIATHHPHLTDVQIKILVDAGYPIGTKYTVVKFANNVKVFASILTGIPIEKFEDQEFKKTILDPKWDYWAINLTMNGLHFESDATSRRFATKEEAETYGQMFLDPGADLTYEVAKVQMTVRDMLQRIGTEAMRDKIHPDSWVNSLLGNYVNQQWIVTDVRFPNEFEAIKNLGGLNVRVIRPMMPDNNHRSETALDSGFTFNVYLDNSKNIMHLIAEVKDKILPLINQ
jgi:hypothetical protein